MEEKEKLIKIKERFRRWCNTTIEVLKESLAEIEQVGIFLINKPQDMIFSDAYAELNPSLVIGWIFCIWEQTQKMPIKWAFLGFLYAVWL